MKLVFNKIHKDTIFDKDFDNLNENYGTIEFKRNGLSGGIAVVYAPNGSGKSSFAEVLKNNSASDNIDFNAKDENGNDINPESDSFHVISDQISRHIIKGDESEYLVGKNIRREYELDKLVAEEFNNCFKNVLFNLFKSKYSITKVSDELLRLVEQKDKQAYLYIKDIVNSKSKGNNINRAQFLSYIQKNKNLAKPTQLDVNNTNFIINNYSKTNIISTLLGIKTSSFNYDKNAILLEQFDDAIKILTKYRTNQNCIVCDTTNIDADNLLNKKTTIRNNIYQNLNEDIKKVLKEIVCSDSLEINDYFKIKEVVSAFISGNDQGSFALLQKELNDYLDNITQSMIYDLCCYFDYKNLINKFNELSQLKSVKPKIDSDDLIYIEKIISDNIDKKITIDRKSDNNFKLMLDDAPLLNVERDEMHLSTGEQNFISLAFELLLAKNSQKKYIVLDDPISSFDSIYKNKIAYCIIKFIEDKNQIILTHNLELVRLLECQKNSCFNLYILNNHDGAVNGFIPVNDEEKKLLTDLSCLVSFFQNKDGKLSSSIKDKRLFLISMIPFMRGYAHIQLDNNDYYGLLSKVMHGYNSDTVDLVLIYKELFGYNFGGNENVSVSDIINLNCDSLDFFDNNKYPLLADTLNQTLIYYYLRMKVEKSLVNIFNIPIKQNTILLLNQIIQKAFNAKETDSDYEFKRECKIFFASRKTLLNEFNHFEGNINIFQPAIDITSDKLKKEVNDINSKLIEIENIYINKNIVI